MVSKSKVNQLTKGDLESICKKYNVAIPAGTKTKADLVNFIMGYPNWNPSLDVIFEGSTGKITAAKKAPSAKSEVSDDIQKKLTETTAQLQKFEGMIEKKSTDLEAKINRQMSALKEELIKFITQQLSKTSTAAPISSKSMYDIESEVLEAIPENEFVSLDDVFSFLDNIKETDFKKSIKRLLLFKIIEGQEGDGTQFIELVDGTKVFLVKKKE